jgi:sugar phosphate isomerase/epimerase
MKRSILISICILMLYIPTTGQAIKTYDNSALEKLEWKLAVQAWTFRLFTLEETLDKLNELGIKYIELYPGQKLGAKIEGTTAYEADEKTRKRIKELLDKKGIKAINYGVVGGNTEEQWNQIFAFADYMGIETIVSEPMVKFMDHVETLCDKYNIRLAVHNHPKPTRYWHPDIVASVIAARSNKIGVCGDIGHWTRSGLNPVECVSQLQGKFVSFHFKDLNNFGVRSAHDVPWGTGNCNVAGVMHELKRQGFKGSFSIEYEYNWENSMPEVAESIAYFYRVAHWLVSATD